ncbi:DNA-protecting protein DprA [bacterium]|nr:DNA-protecting protein DprA [bacterium]
MTSDNFHHLLLLSSIPGIGHAKIRSLVNKFGSAENVLRAPLHQLVATDGFDQKTAEKILSPSQRDPSFVEDQIKLLDQYHANIVTFWDEEYPENLKNIFDPPAFLFVRGTLSDTDRYSVAVVGTRECTSYGKWVTESLSQELAIRGITVVSGLARGIDTIAHITAIKNGGRTLAVLGSGVDRIYPSENFKLAMDIADHGALISDYPMRTAPDAVNFPGRNRIISGISLGTLIVEAGEKSGALITAEYATEQNREVFAIPGNVNVRQSRGPNRLIKNGAKLVESVDDILVELEHKLMPLTHPVKKEKILQLNNQEQSVYDCVANDPRHIDHISRTAKLSTGETLSYLLNLELMGAVKQLSGKHFVKI